MDWMGVLHKKMGGQWHSDMGKIFFELSYVGIKIDIDQYQVQ
jgi:hypothetical protein